MAMWQALIEAVLWVVERVKFSRLRGVEIGFGGLFGKRECISNVSDTKVIF